MAINKTTSRMIIGVLIAACVIVTLFAWLRADYEQRNKTATNQSLYDADKPAATPTLPRLPLIVLTPQELAKAPLIDFFTHPLGDTNGAFAYNAQDFGASNKKRGGNHTGQDWNGIGGENTDISAPVRAAARGLLIYAGEPSPAWGNVVILLHRLPNGSFIQTLYAHLDRISDLPIGSLVGRGEQIGTVGTAHGHYLAHLHFEVIESIVHEAGMPGYAVDTLNRIDPEPLFEQYAPPAQQNFPDPLPAIKKLHMAGDWERLMSQIVQDNPGQAVEHLLPPSQPDTNTSHEPPSAPVQTTNTQ